MLKFLTKLLILLPGLLLGRTAAQNPTPTISSNNNLILQSPDIFYLYWDYNIQNITFELHVKNTSWLLFGIKGTSYSNVIVASVFPDGIGHYSERTLLNNNSLTINPALNWILLDAFNKNDYTVVKFSRKLKLKCNQDNLGVDINTGLNTLIFATGNFFNTSDKSISLSNLNSTQVNLLPDISSATQLNCVNVPPPPVFNSTPTTSYSNYVDLVPGIFRIYWNTTETNLTAEIHCKTQGWVGFGFSPNGGMVGSNVLVGYIASDGSVNFTDRFITSASVSGVAIAKNQSARLLAYGRVNDYTYFKFTRLIKICDSEHISISQGAPSVIYAYGTNQLNPGADISYHSSNRGTQKLNILNVINLNSPIPSDSEYIDISIKNVILPRIDTYYYVELFQVPPSLTPKRHIYAVEIILPTINTMNIHHLLIYECDPLYNGVPAQTSHNSNTDVVKINNCTSVALGWAVGGDLKSYFPSTTGYPIGGDTDYKYFILEVHYNNPFLDIGYIDNLTIRYYMTRELRQNELGVLTLGTDSTGYGIAIPPGLSKFELKTFCHNKCIRSVFAKNPITNITVISANPHTHLAGVSVDTKIIRNGVDIGYLFANHEYDFNYQQSYLLNPYVNITINDELITQCTYNTKDRTGFTLGGDSTRNEMCFNFLFYYPRGVIQNCISVPYLDDYIDLLNKLSSTGDIKFDSELVYDYSNLTYGLVQAFTQFSYMPTISSRVVSEFVDFYNKTRLSELCHYDQDYGPLNRLVPSNVYIETDICAISNQESTSSLIQQIIKAISNLIASISGFFSRLFGWS